MKRFFSTFAVGIAMSAVFAAGNLGAVDLMSRSVTVPFEFQVNRSVLPAGDYRVERDLGKAVIYLVNVRTGQRVQFMRDGAAGARGPITLTFESTPQGRKLVKIS